LAAIDQEVREGAREDERFFPGVVVVGDKINRVFVE
jgi:hypothetical protein